MREAAIGALAASAGLLAYAYAVYPLLLRLLDLPDDGQEEPVDASPDRWPTVSVSLPAYNEEAVIGDALENLLALEYPRDRLQIVVVSDSSTDRTEEIVRSYADRGVELVRVESRGGKTAAENAAVPHLDGEIVVNTDATARPRGDSLKALVRTFRDPEVGVASGRDVSVGSAADAVQGESGYVGYEMWVRDLETRTGGIVGSSGCLYAIRRCLHRKPVPEELSRDFISALNAREEGFRAVSVSDALVEVPRARSLREEYRRKVRTMVRGLGSLWYKRSLLNPFRWGAFAWKLGSHKLARWLVPLSGLPAFAALSYLGVTGGIGWQLALAASVVTGSAGAAALAWPDQRTLPRPLALCGYLLVAMAAGVHAWGKALALEHSPTWEPTRRETEETESAQRGEGAGVDGR